MCNLYSKYLEACALLGNVEIEMTKLVKLLLGRNEVSVSIDSIVVVHFSGPQLEESALNLIARYLQFQSGFAIVQLVWIPPTPKFKLFEVGLGATK
jgi:hypothetical protein